MKLTKKLLNKLIKEEFEKTILKEQLAPDPKKLQALGRMTSGVQEMMPGDFELVSELIRNVQELLETRINEFNELVKQGGPSMGREVDISRLG